MPSYKVIVAGTDGSETSLRAVDKAAAIAAETEAKMIVASACVNTEHGSGGPDPDEVTREDYRTVGKAPIYDLLRDAAARARRAGAADIEERVIEGAPADAFISWPMTQTLTFLSWVVSA